MTPAALQVSLLLLGLLGCGSPPTSAGSDAKREAQVDPEPTPIDATCSEAAIEAEMVAYCDFEAQVPSELLAGVAWSGPAFHLLDQRLVVIDAQAKVRIAGESGELDLAAWAADPGPSDRPLVLAIAGSLPAASVGELFASLHAASRSEFGVLVRSDAPGQTLPTPPDPALLDEIARRLPDDLSTRAMQLATQMHEHTKTCPALATALQSLASLAPADRCTGMAALIAGAIVECRCSEADAIMTLLYAISVGTRPPKGRVSAITITLDPSAAITPAPAPSATWADLVGQHLGEPTAKRLWLAGASE